MRSTYMLAISALAGLSSSLIVSRDPAHDPSITPHATPTEASSRAGLSQRGDWDDFAEAVVTGGTKGAVDIISHIFDDDQKWTTATVTQDPDPTTDSVTVTATVTEDPEPTTDSVTVTATITAPGSFTTVTHTGEPGTTASGPVTVTTTASQSVVTTTEYTLPGSTDTTTAAPPPRESGCYFALPGGQLTVAPCGPHPFKFVPPPSAG